MMPRCLYLLLLICCSAHGQVLSYGSSPETVESELGPADSTLSTDSGEILTYADGTQLEFIDNKLVRANEQTLMPDGKQDEPAGRTRQPLLHADEIIQQRDGRTIGASLQEQRDQRTLADIEAELRAGDAAASLGMTRTQKQHLQEVAVTFGIEFLITFLVLSIALQVGGFSVVFRQIILISLCVAMLGALLDTLLQLGPLHPIRSLAGFVILIPLILQMTAIRTWPTAIKVAATARLVSLLIIWLTMLGLAGVSQL